MMWKYINFWKSSPYFRGAVWKVSSFICFSAINGIVRYLSQAAETNALPALPAYEVAFFQNLFGLIFLVPWIVNNGPQSLKTKQPLLQISRIALSAIGVVLWYTSLAYMQIAQAVALMFLGPLITAIGARMFLKENIGADRGLAITIGFVGGGLVSQATFLPGAFSLVALLPVFAATCFSGATLMIRRLTRDDSPQLVVTYLLVFMAPALFIPTILYGYMPETWQWPWLVIMGGLAAGAHLCLSKAYATAEVSYLIPYGFTKWIASALIGFAAFAEVPSIWTCLGAIILMGAIVSLSYTDVKRRVVPRVA